MPYEENRRQVCVERLEEDCLSQVRIVADDVTGEGMVALQSDMLGECDVFDEEDALYCSRSNEEPKGHGSNGCVVAERKGI